MPDSRPWRITERLLAGRTIFVLYDAQNEPVCHTGTRDMAERLARTPQIEAELDALKTPQQQEA